MEVPNIEIRLIDSDGLAEAEIELEFIERIFWIFKNFVSNIMLENSQFYYESRDTKI